QMTALRSHGLTQAAIAKRMGMSEKTVRTWLKQGVAPTWKRQFRRRSVFDSYAAYVQQRWQEGVHEGKQLYGRFGHKGFLAPYGPSSALCRHFETIQRRSCL